MSRDTSRQLLPCWPTTHTFREMPRCLLHAFSLAHHVTLQQTEPPHTKHHICRVSNFLSVWDGVETLKWAGLDKRDNCKPGCSKDQNTTCGTHSIAVQIGGPENDTDEQRCTNLALICLVGRRCFDRRRHTRRPPDFTLHAGSRGPRAAGWPARSTSALARDRGPAGPHSTARL